MPPTPKINLQTESSTGNPIKTVTLIWAASLVEGSLLLLKLETKATRKAMSQLEKERQAMELMAPSDQTSARRMDLAGRVTYQQNRLREAKVHETSMRNYRIQVTTELKRRAMNLMNLGRLPKR